MVCRLRIEYIMLFSGHCGMTELIIGVKLTSKLEEVS